MNEKFDRNRIMSEMGSVIEEIDDYIHWIDMHKGRASTVDEQFSEGLKHIIDDMRKFHSIWEERTRVRGRHRIWEERY